MSKPSVTKADLDELFRTLDLAVFKIPDVTRVEDENGVVSFVDSQGAPRMMMSSQTEAELMAWSDSIPDGE